MKFRLLFVIILSSVLAEGCQRSDPEEKCLQPDSAHDSSNLSATAELHFNRGLAFQKKHEYDKAIEAYNEAIRLDPQMIAAYNEQSKTQISMFNQCR